MGYIIKPIDMSEEAKNKMRLQALKAIAELKPINDLTNLEIQNMRAQAQYLAEQALKWQPFIRGKVSTRVENAIRGAYQRRVGAPKKAINELSDKEILSIRNIGQKSLAEIRKYSLQNT